MGPRSGPGDSGGRQWGPPPAGPSRVLRLRGGGGDAEGVRVPCASVNVDRLSAARWAGLVEVLGNRDPLVAVCAVQHHQLPTWSHLDDSEYVLWANPCARGAAENPAGGVARL